MKKLLHCLACLQMPCLLILSLAGCGGKSSSTTDIAALRGNWLVTGSLPTLNGAGPGGAQPFSLTLTLDVANNEVLAAGSEYYPCAGLSVGATASFLPAPIAADGTFTLQTVETGPVVPTILVTVHGAVANLSGGDWSGTYSATNANAGCAPVSGSFTAVPIQPVTGTFRGVGSLGAAGSGPAVPVTLTTVFEQGAVANQAPPPGELASPEDGLLTGTISIAGSPCFTTGTGAVPMGAVLGDSFFAQFSMNDGSRLLLNGSVQEAATTSLVLTSVVVLGGNCNGWVGSTGSVLMRQ